MAIRHSLRLAIFCAIFYSVFISKTWADGSVLQFNLRRQVRTDDSENAFEHEHKNVQWDAKETAVIVCDMWTVHWCKGATDRDNEFAPRLNEVVRELRDQGVFVIHCPSPPSDDQDPYRDWKQRKRAYDAPEAPRKEIPLKYQPGWVNLFGSNWQPSNAFNERPMPLDVTDDGCGCFPQCSHGTGPGQRISDSRQTPAIAIEQNDAIAGDNFQAFNLIRERNIENVVILGVHLNICMLGRPYGIRFLTGQDLNVVLVRDVTDTLYNPRMPPYTSRAESVSLVVDHIERYLCPTISSTDVDGKPAFVFHGDAAEIAKHRHEDGAAWVPRDGSAEWNRDHQREMRILNEVKQRGPVEILFLGDSITQAWKGVNAGAAVWDRHYAKRHAHAFGVAGTQTQNLLWQIVDQGVFDGIAPKLVVILVGTNNLSCCPHHTDEDIAKGIEAVVKAVRVKSPDSRVVLMNVLPRDDQSKMQLLRRIRSINDKIAWIPGHATRCLRQVAILDIGNEFLDQNGRIRENLMSDAVYPNAQGYEVWARAVEPFVERQKG